MARYHGHHVESLPNKKCETVCPYLLYTGTVKTPAGFKVLTVVAGAPALAKTGGIKTTVSSVFAPLLSRL